MPSTAPWRPWFFLASRDIERPTFWIEKAGPTPIFSSFHHLAERWW
jgi:hypothetical protein